MKSRSIVTYSVWGLDVWGHSSAECEDGCSCVDDEGTHDDDSCNCSFEVNDRHRLSTIRVETDEGISYNATAPEHRYTSWSISDGALLRALKNQRLVAAHVTENDLTFEYEEDNLLCIDQASDGRPLLQLQYEGHVELPVETAA